MSQAMWPLQVAMYSLAANDSTLDALVTGVFDEVPEGQPLPYVSLGSMTSVEADAHNQLGEDINAVWDVWSGYRGNKESAQILAALDVLFHRAELDVDGFEYVTSAREQALTLGDPDPDIRHISVRYRVWLTQSKGA